MSSKMTQELFDVVLSVLEQHTCVIVPGLGGFVVNESPARYSSIEDTFYPPRREIYFNNLLSHNDGLVIQEYMRMGYANEEANRRVREVVSCILKEIETGKSVMTGDWGVLSREGRNFRFVQIRQVLPNKTSFGLQEFYFPRIKNSDPSVWTEEKTEKEIDTKFSFKPLLVGSLTLLALLFFIQPLENGNGGNISLQSANLVMANLNAEVSMQNQEIKKLQCELDKYHHASEGFYLILKDFSTLKDAQEFLDGNSLVLPQEVRIISLREKYYVSVASALSKEDLMEQKENLDMEESFMDKSYVLSVTKLGNK